LSKIVERTLDFLELFADEKRPLSLSEISKLLDIPVSSCHDVLQALQDRGYLYEIAPRAGYYPTVRLLDIAKIIADNDPVVIRAEIVLRALRDAVDESVLLSKTSGTTATYLLSFEPSHPLRFTVNIGQRVRSLYATSAGKAQLASLDKSDFDAFLKSAKLVALTPNTITSKAALRDDIEKSRRRGWFANREESQKGVVTLSASFVWNAATYIVTIAGPSSRLSSRMDLAAAKLVEACAKLEMRSPGN
jgi:DNA-binding IclR family transcriptional regulator